MKNWKILVLLFNLFLLFWVSFGYQQQWFSYYQEWADWISFSCQNQCAITLWQKDKIDYLDLNWNIKWNGIIAYWFLVWDQISLLNQYEVVVSSDINDSMNFVEYKQYFSSIPWNTDIILLVNGNVNWKIKLDLGKFSFGQKFSQGRKQASQYYEYNPRTINFLEWPMRNWKYINQYFLKFLTILLTIGLVWYFFASKKWKRKALIYTICVLAFFRVFFSYFSTKNQIKIYNDTIDATDIMENWRVWKSSDFYQFLDFIKSKVSNWEKWYFIAPYPFDFEWKYHIYPDVKFDSITWVNYIFYYNPYWSDTSSALWFKEPRYSEWMLMRGENKISIKDVIDRKDYAKIYIVK